MLATFLLSSLLFLAAPAVAPGSHEGPPAAVHVGSYGSPLGARVTPDGLVDVGSLVARFVDLDSGEPIAFTRPVFSKGPGLKYVWRHQAESWRAEGEIVGVTQNSGADVRLATGLRVLLHNEESDPITVRIGLELYPEPAGDGMRPALTHAYAVGERWEQNEHTILRDGQLVAQWAGLAPDVEVLSPDGPSAPALRLAWRITLPPRNKRYVEALLFGQPSTGAVNEERFQRAVARRGFRDLDDQQRWEGRALGEFSGMVMGDERFRDAYVAAVAQIRTLGSAYQAVTHLSDQPYGRRATDAAVSAQMLGVIFEVGMHEIAGPYFNELMEQAPELMAELEPARQLMFLHGLARVARLSMVDMQSISLGDVLRGFLVSGVAEGLPVDPWLHPENVRLDLKAVLDRSGQGGAELLPEFSWAAVQPGSIEDSMQQLSRAIHDRDNVTAWAQCSSLLDRTSRWGFGSLSPDGEADGAWALAMGSLLREVLFDDHGDELHLLPGSDRGLISDELGIETQFMATRFGWLKLQQFHSGKRLVGGRVLLRMPRWPERIVMYFAPSEGLKMVKPTPEGGYVELLDEHSAELVILPDAVLGLRFSVRVQPADDLPELPPGRAHPKKKPDRGR